MHMLCVVATLALATPTAEDLEGGELKSRRSLASGHVVFSAVFESRPDNSKKEVRYEIWYDRDHYRIDVREGMSPREIYCENCERPNHYVWYTEANLGTKTPPIRLCLMGVPGVVLGQHLKFDARIVGAGNVPYYVLGNVPLNICLGRTDRTEPKISKTLFKEKEAWQMEYTLNFGVLPQIHTTFLKKQEDTVLARIETDATIAGAKETDRTEIDPGEFGKWSFPKAVTFEKTVAGKWKEKEKWTTEVAEFNDAVPASIFSLAAMKIPAGADVYLVHPKPKEKGKLKWDGEKIVPYKENFAVLFPDRSPPTAPRSRQVLLTTAVVLFLMGTIFFWKHLRRRANG